MTREEFLKGLSNEAGHYAQNVFVQLDDALARLDAVGDRIKAVEAREAAHLQTVADHQEEMAGFRQQVADAQAAVETATETHAKELAEHKAMIDALGGTELGQKMARERRRAELEAMKATADAELVMLDKGEVEIGAVLPLRTA